MKRAKFFRYHVLGLLFWVTVTAGVIVAICNVSLPDYLQGSAIGDVFGLMVIPAGALILWVVTLADRALGGAYDQPTEWDELDDKPEAK